MAVKGLTALTLADWGKRIDPNGKVDKIIELLSQTNPILQDMPFVEGNLPTGHRTTVRTGLPSATWRLLNYGVKQSKSTTVQVTDSCGMLETYSEVDKSLADLNGNTAEFRLSEDRAFIEAMNQQMAQTLFYGDTSVNPQQFMGLSSRYSSLSAGNAQNIIDGGFLPGFNLLLLDHWHDLGAVQVDHLLRLLIGQVQFTGDRFELFQGSGIKLLSFGWFELVFLRRSFWLLLFVIRLFLFWLITISRFFFLRFVTFSA